MKGVSLGEAVANASRPGSEAHDAIHYEPGRGFFRATNRAGGLEGGIGTGTGAGGFGDGVGTELPDEPPPQAAKLDSAPVGAATNANRRHRIVRRAAGIGGSG